MTTVIPPFLMLLACGGEPAAPEPSAAPAPTEAPVPSDAPAEAPEPAVEFSPTNMEIGHCAKTERMRMSCGVGKGKSVALCESADGLSYRFGKPGALELRLPAEGFSTDFEIGHRRTGEDSEVYTASVWNDGHRYTIRSERTEDQFDITVVVRKGAEKLATLTCKDETSADWTEIRPGLYDGDANAADAWVGEWVAESAEAGFTITQTDAGLVLKGDATWHGMGDRIHTGEAEGTLSGKGADRELKPADADSGCEIRLQRKGVDEVDAEDNLKCGGMNVTFSSTYFRTP